jgi:hypothetical protein
MKHTDETQHVDIAGYLLDMLAAEDRRAVKEHLANCAECRAEVDGMRGWTAKLAAVPEPMRLDGPPDDADLLLGRTLRQIRDEGTGRRRRRVAAVTGLTVAAAAVAVLGGVLVGRVTAPPAGPPLAQPGTSAPALTMVPGTRRASATDAMTGARISVSLVPAVGWVRLTATVGGIPAGERCRLEVVGRDGTAILAGSWLVSPAGEANGTPLSGTALLAPDQVAAIRVTNAAGGRFVSVPI